MFARAERATVMTSSEDREGRAARAVEPAAIFSRASNRRTLEEHTVSRGDRHGQLRVSIRSDLQTGPLDIHASGPTAPCCPSSGAGDGDGGLPRAAHGGGETRVAQDRLVKPANGADLANLRPLEPNEFRKSRGDRRGAATLD